MQISTSGAIRRTPNINRQESVNHKYERNDDG